jgi:hypothetical protein
LNLFFFLIGARQFLIQSFDLVLTAGEALFDQAQETRQSFVALSVFFSRASEARANRLYA